MDPIVYDYLDIFPKELLGMPPKWENQLSIVLLLGTLPISNAPYSMGHAKLKELNCQLTTL